MYEMKFYLMMVLHEKLRNHLRWIKFMTSHLVQFMAVSPKKVDRLTRRLKNCKQTVKEQPCHTVLYIFCPLGFCSLLCIIWQFSHSFCTVLFLPLPSMEKARNKLDSDWQRDWSPRLPGAANNSHNQPVSRPINCTVNPNALYCFTE